MASGDTDNNNATASADTTRAAPSPDASNLGGRPTVWTAELESLIIADIAAGNSERISAEANGIAYSTFRAHRDDFPVFSAQCQKARAEGIRERAREYRTTDNPVRAKVCHHWLAVKDRDEWAETHKHELSGAVNVTATLAALFAADAGEERLDGDAE